MDFHFRLQVTRGEPLHRQGEIADRARNRNRKDDEEYQRQDANQRRTDDRIAKRSLPLPQDRRNIIDQLENPDLSAGKILERTRSNREAFAAFINDLTQCLSV